LLALVACAVPRPSTVRDYGETLAGLPPETVLAWNFEVVGDVARWRECVAMDTCGTLERSRPANEVLSVERVAQASIDGRQVDVLRLSLVARRSCDYSGCSDRPDR